MIGSFREESGVTPPLSMSESNKEGRWMHIRFNKIQYTTSIEWLIKITSLSMHGLHWLGKGK